MAREIKRWGPYRGTRGHVFYTAVFDDGSTKTVYAHREQMEQHLARRLRPDEHIHHKNEVSDDNRIDNYEICTPSAHAREHLQARQAPAEWVHVVCPVCGRTFQREAREIRYHQKKKGKAGPFCDKSCAGQYSRRRQIEGGRVNLRR